MSEKDDGINPKNGMILPKSMTKDLGQESRLAHKAKVFAKRRKKSKAAKKARRRNRK